MTLQGPSSRPCDRPYPPTPPLPSRRGGASTPVPLLLRHGSPARAVPPSGQNLDAGGRGPQRHLADDTGATCSFPLRLRPLLPPVRCSSTPLKSHHAPGFLFLILVPMTPPASSRPPHRRLHSPAPRTMLHSVLVAVIRNTETLNDSLPSVARAAARSFTTMM